MIARVFGGWMYRAISCDIKKSCDSRHFVGQPNFILWANVQGQCLLVVCWRCGSQLLLLLQSVRQLKAIVPISIYWLDRSKVIFENDNGVIIIHVHTLGIVHQHGIRYWSEFYRICHMMKCSLFRIDNPKKTVHVVQMNTNHTHACACKYQAYVISYRLWMPVATICTHTFTCAIG